MRRALVTAREHPRHLVLGALVAGLLTATINDTAVVMAAALAALLVAFPLRPAPPTDTPDPPVRRRGASPSASASPRAAAPDPAPSRASAVAGSPLVVALVVAALVAGAAFTAARLSALDAGVLAASTGRAIDTRAVVLEPVKERAIGPAVARVRLIDGLGAREQAVLRFAAPLRPWPEVGDIVAVRGIVAPLGFADAYQRRRNAHAAIAATLVEPTGTRRGGIAGTLDGVRRRAERGLAQGLKPPEAALMRGMVLGEDERLSEDVRDDFQRSGLAHILAVSGQNVVLLIVLVLAACALTGVPLRTRLVIAAAVVILYVPLAGGGPSIQRAGVMGVAGLIAALAGRPARRWYALLLAAAATLMLNPRAAGEPGWQLSFAAVIALLIGAAPLKRRLARRMPDPLAEATAITVAATVGTAPLMALHFEQLSLVSLPANLFAAPAIAPVMWLGVLAGVAGQLSAPLALPFAALTAPLLVYLQHVAHLSAAAPLATVELHAPPAIVAAAWMLALLAAAIAARAWRRARGSMLSFATDAGERTRTPPRRRLADPEATAPARRGPRTGRRRARGRGPAAATSREPPVGRARRARRARSAARCARRPSRRALVAATVLVIALRGAEAAPRPGELVVSFLDVGQGDATLVQLGTTAVLVDTGPPEGPISSA